MKISKMVVPAGLIGALLLFTGCGAKGPKFTSFEKPKPNEGLVYVYRPSSFVGSGVYYDIHVTNPMTPDFIAGELTNGAYLKIDVPTGESEIWGKTEAKSSVTLDVKDGDIKCVKGSVGMGLFVGRPNLEIVDFETCKSEIIGTNEPK